MVDLNTTSALAWIYNNNLITENQKPLEFRKHRFLIDPITDMSPEQVYRKSAQVGMSVAMILKSFWLAKYAKINVAHCLPTNNVVQDFVAPKVNPLINSNPVIADMVSKDSITLKQIGDRFIFYRGSFSDRQAISISIDALILDELDRMPDQTVINTYDSRLQASEYGFKWSLSNPSVPNFGVDKLFKGSDQHYWFVKHSCGYEWFMEFEKGDKNHYVDKERGIYACGACDEEITDKQRIAGRWIAKYPGRERRGYHIDQLIAPWVSAKKVLRQFEDSSVEFFHNFVLGLPYQAAELVVDRATILRATTPMQVAKTNVVMGIDNGVVKDYVIGTPSGIFAYGKTESWEEIEALIRMYNAIAVIDGNPYPNIPKQLARTYRGKVFVNYYIQDTKRVGIIRWDEGEDYGMVKSDRTQLLDMVASDINSGAIRFAMNPSQMEDMIYHWENIRRTVEKNEKGVEKGVWLTSDNKPDHLAHAVSYYRIGLEKAMAPDSGGVTPNPPSIRVPGLLVNPDNTFDPGININQIAEESLEEWKYR